MAFGLAGLALIAAPPAVAQTINDPGLQIDLVVGGLSSPTSMAFIGDGDILVLQKDNGQVRRVLNGVLLPAAVLDVAVHFSSERGLLGIAIDPDFIDNRHVYLYYTETPTVSDTGSSSVTPLGNRVYRYTWNGTALIDPLLVLHLPATPGPNHDGGVIAFGPDDALYAVIGDLNRSGKLQNFPTGPDPDDTGVILRVDALGRALPDNPFFDPANPSAPMGRYFGYGVRNSFGFAFDPVTRGLWDTENGPSFFDEVNRVVGGYNSGWVPIMGPDARDPQGVGDLWVAPRSTYRDPAFSWAVPVAPAAIAFAASPVLGCGLLHDILVGDNNCGQIYRFRPNAARDALDFTSTVLQDRVADNGGLTCTAEMDEIRYGSGFGVVTDLENGPDGRLYVVSLTNGAIYRIGPKAGAVPDADRDGVGDACDCAPSDSAAFALPSEVLRLRVRGGSPTTFGWDAQAAVAGSGTTSTVVSGDLVALRAERGFASACTLASGLDIPQATETRPDPPVGSGYYYLVRAANDCGAGTFGDGSGSPDPRDALDAASPPPCAGAGQTGGAFATFSIVGESLAVWVTDGPFIDRAKELLATGGRQIPIFNRLLDGRDADPQWSWHPDPGDVTFADAAIEVCDGLPSDVEADKDYWLRTLGYYCPWAAVVASVDDRR
jgi:glucose/arabinose dehydrogenase